MRTSKKLMILGYIFIMLLIILSYVAWLYSVSFTGNILPELIGFSLEGLFFVVVFAMYNQYKNRKIEQKQKEFIKVTVLTIVVNFSKSLLEIVSPAWNINQQTVGFRKTTYDLLKKDFKRTDDELKQIRDVIQCFLPVFITYTTKIAEINLEHAETWNNFVIYLNSALVEKDNESSYEAISKAIDELIDLDDSLIIT